MNPQQQRGGGGGGPHHRRAHSDTSFRFSGVDDDDDDFLLDLENFNLSSLDLVPPQSPSLPMVSDESSADTTTVGPHNTNRSTPPGVAPHHHLRSLSVDGDFFEGLSFGSGGERKVEVGGGGGGGGKMMHRRTNSMDGGGVGTTSSGSMMYEGGGESMLVDGVKKAMPPERLAELALIDPKRAKRILANRQSAARSKERKIRYTGELERRVQTLQTEATTLSAQVTLLQRDTTGLTIENKELKLRLQALEQQAQLRDALNEALRQEVQRLRIATGQIPASNNNSSGRGMFAQFSAHPQNAPSFGGPQNQSQPQPHPQTMHQQQFQMADQSAGNNPGVHKQLKPNFMNFNHKG